ncbi:MAG: hypothetical protein WB524_17995 [Acidobacteriaceae bacterium]
MFLDLGDGFEVGSADELFFPARGLLEEDDIDIIEGGEFFLDLPDELFVPGSDLLSLVKVHVAKVGSGVAFDHPKNG